ncbi:MULTISPECIES: hydroxyacid dehydrogenase [unclassified Mesorhizobium]|uniref:hydroxyacid dehydrogenase n=1 Tax=unclassified Mesorhizobium TaxID=325217 RepID=UPI000FCAD122|nr:MULTISPECIES: hydroxyacid dehydrogenase [unclassified Mesorhizobium]RUV42947.1 hydroxyacid dehydrogenase [Mesorhizobium sp. M1A.T.Ca.IN.004.03.1.1]RWI91733.1 MAG: hydroxyacid dehydrogenase [Mesorhizobium sp.]RWK38064.1 MAG: hydroxyacid dehydrogenase [Mesorhizobium sp.]RWK90958.1 MAG: hydroxyacid dehydrogenase [Mesorhizobium sp.]TIP17192.1 MAG: hydroxyacid dehydrogenase [Mesorhizobium sp.]
MRKILSTHPLHPRATSMLAGAGRLVVASALDARTLAAEAKDADIVIVRALLPPELFAGASLLRAAIRHGAGLDMIPVEAATAAGVLVANVPAVNARSVAEHVVFTALALLRRFRIMDRDLRAKGWLAGREHANSTSELAGKTIGIVGLGAVGQAVGHIAAHGFDLKVVATTRSLRPAPERVGFLSIDALVEQSDIIVLCCPLTEETRGLISRERIARMKPNALLINVSRGPVVDDEALIEALRKGRIGGAALDVFATQPLPPSHPYFSFDNVIITPHMAGITEESMMRMGVGAANEALLVLADKLPVNLRNPEVIERYRRRFPAD